MSIALDTTGISTNQSASPVTLSYTCTGSQGVLVVFVVLVETVSGTPTCTGVTFGGMNMNKFGRAALATSYEISGWLLSNPPTAADTIKATVTGFSTLSACIMAESLTGVNQSNYPDFNTTVTGTATGNQSFNTTTQTSNCWVVAAGMNSSGGTPVGCSALQTSRQTITTLGASSRRVAATIEDNNATTANPSAVSMGFNITFTTIENGWAFLGVSLSPAGAANEYFRPNRLRPRIFGPGLAK